MKESIIADLVLRHISGNISAEDEATLQQWRAASPRNAQAFDTLTGAGFLESGYKEWRSIDTAKAQRSMERRLRAERMRRARSVFRQFGVSAVCIAAGLFIGLGITSRRQVPATAEVAPAVSAITPGKTAATLTTTQGEVIGVTRIALNKPKSPKPVREPKSLNDLSTPRGGEFHITLEDGTEVWLNAQTSLRYPETFSDSLREVEIVGEGYFKVAKDQSRPFVVRSGNQLIKVYGTEFNVNSYEDDDEVVTTLVEGSIALTYDNHSSNEVLLSPGHQAVYRRSSDAMTVGRVDTEAATGWRNDLFVFDDQSLDRIMKQLGRWYDFEYEFSDSTLAGIEFKGSIPRYAEIGDAIAILEMSGGMAFRIDGRTIVISRKK